MKLKWGILMSMVMLAGCVSEPQLEKITFKDIPGWEHDNLIEAAPAYKKSCEVLLRKKPLEMLGYENVESAFDRWKNVCRVFLENPPQTSSEFRAFLKSHFDAYAVRDENEGQGLFTGYYEPFIAASKTPTKTYATPVYFKPDDLVIIEDLGIFRSSLKGERIAGRLHHGTLRPYATRQEIEAGYLLNKNLEIAWVKDPVDLFFLHIQGSGRLVFEDGSTQGIGYDGTNGQPYFAIGKALYERGHLPKEQINLQSIKDWLKAHPQEAQEIMHLNPSYVFFKIREVRDPVGSQGVELTPKRSLAVDRKWVEMGNLLWLDAEHPHGHGRLQRLMVAQDTGGAIKGAVRGDYYWGSGENAEILAGPMKSKGTFYIFVPR